MLLGALAVVLLVSGCSAASGQTAGGGGGDDPAGSGSPAAAGPSCGHDEAMGRPCPPDATGAVARHRPRYKTDRDAGQYGGDAYRGTPVESCKPRLKESPMAFKACVGY